VNKPTRIVVSAVLLVACSTGGYIVGMQDFIATKALLKHFDQQESLQTSQLEVLAQQFELKQMELQTERAKSAALLKDLDIKTAIAAESEAELSLFRKVMSPEKEAGGVEINSVNIVPLAQKNRFRLNIALLQVGRTKPLASGKLSLSLSGLQVGQPATVKHDLLLESKSKELKFSFRYLTELETILILPEGFEADSLGLSLNFSRGGYRGKSSIDQNYAWKSLQKTP